PSGCSRTCPSASTTRVGAAMRGILLRAGIIGEPLAARQAPGACRRGDECRKRGARVPHPKLYLHEMIHIIGTGSEAYKRHTGERTPSGPAGVLVGTWQQSGSTGDWPRVVNLWEMDGWEGWGRILEHQYGGQGQPAALARWWRAAARLRSGGFDRILA